MYYGYRCYSKDHQPLGWLYTFDCGREYAWTNIDLDWCKRWKTQKGAEKHFDTCNKCWQFKSQGGYLKIEIMPEIVEEKSKSYQHLDSGCESQDKPTWFFVPDADNRRWLEEERQDENGEPESDTALLNRKLTKLRKLEEQGL
jgi:hypothetical protein